VIDVAIFDITLLPGHSLLKNPAKLVINIRYIFPYWLLVRLCFLLIPADHNKTCVWGFWSLFEVTIVVISVLLCDF